jgi:hypothetical protein
LYSTGYWPFKNLSGKFLRIDAGDKSVSYWKYLLRDGLNPKNPLHVGTDIWNER